MRYLIKTKYLLGIAILISLVILTFININRVKNDNKELELNQKKSELLNEKMQKLYSIGERYIGLKINSLQNVLGDSVYKSKYQLIIFLYSGFDCGTCVLKGLAQSATIDSILSKHKSRVFVIASNTNYGVDQLNSGYHKYIFNDVHESIRKELKYLYTPIFIQLNGDRTVESIYFPLPLNNDLHFRKFINNILNEENK